MLARLETIDGLQLAEVDHRGELLRLVVAGRNVLELVERELAGLGYQSEPVGGLTASDVRWYGFNDVRDLSREEAEIIARRVTGAFASSHALRDADRIRIEEAVTAALYACFATNDLGSAAPSGSLRAACSHAVESAVRGLLGGDAARDYVALLWKDLDA